MAQLIIDGKNYGLTPFIVQIRDMKTHEPMPGKHESFQHSNVWLNVNVYNLEKKVI